MDGAFQACRRNAGATFGTAVIIMAIVSLLTWALTQATFDFSLLSDEQPTDDEVISFLTGYLGGSLLIGLFTAAGIFLLQGLLVVVVARACLDRRTGFAQLWRIGASRVPRLLLLLLLYCAAVVAVSLLVAGVTALTVPALGWGAALVAILLAIAASVAVLWVGIKLCLAPAVLVLEGIGVMASLRRSWLLTGGNWWRTFGILLLTSLIAGVITSVVATPVSFLAGLLAAAVAGDDPGAYLNLFLPATLIVTNVFSAVAYAFQSSVTALLYVDLRIRREGFDVALLREQESAPADEDAVPGSGPAPTGSGRGRPQPPPAPWG